MMLAMIVMDILNIFNLENRRRREKQLSLTHLMGCHVRQGTCTEIMVKTNRGSCRATNVAKYEEELSRNWGYIALQKAD